MSNSATRRHRSLSITLALAVTLLAGAAVVMHWRVDHSLFDVGLSLVALLLAALLLRETMRGRRREEEMTGQATLLEAMLELSPAGIWVKDADGRFVIVNPAALRQIQLPREQVIGRRTIDVVPADEVQNILEWDKAAFAQPGVTISGEDLFHVDGDVRYAVNSRVVCNIAGRRLIVGSAMDVTALRLAEQELRSEMHQREAAEAELRQAQKMEAIGKLTGGIAHDFNNLLTAVLGNLDLAVPRVSDAAARRLLQRAQAAAERGAKLIAHLLAFARKQHLRAYATDLNRQILGMKDLLGSAIGPTIDIDIVLDDELWPALADANQVEAALLNIAINARDAMPNGGRLRIETANLGADTPGFPTELPPADYVAITIGDTGCGMSEEVLANAFDPFFTTKPFGEGSGLGLSQVYGMTQQSGGTARIESRLGEGTKVSLFLPRAVAASVQRADGQSAGGNVA
jgi:PAS domain S-box-containing protein